MKAAVLVLGVVVTVLVFVGGASAGPPPAPGVSVSNPTPAAGEAFEVNVTGCLPGTTVFIDFNGIQSAAVADVNGELTVSLIAPDSPGTYNGSITCNGATTNFSITVPSAATTTTTTTTTVVDSTTTAEATTTAADAQPAQATADAQPAQATAAQPAFTG